MVGSMYYKWGVGFYDVIQPWGGKDHPLLWKFICFMCAFQVKLLSMYIPKNLAELEKGTVVLLIVIMLSSVCKFFSWGWKSIAVELSTLVLTLAN